MKNYDFIIIGTGAGGGTLARKLAPSGKSILIVERGDYIPREKENWDTNEVFLKARYKAHETWKDKEGKEFHPGIHYCVGGNTKVYGAALLRMREHDFKEVKHYGGISPAWDICYEDLAPYYLEAEKLYAIHGLRGSDPTEPKEKAPYFHTPLKHETRIQEIYNQFETQGYHPFPLPVGFLKEQDDDTAQVPLDRFDGFPDPTESKADAHVVGIREALKYKNVTLLRNSYVQRLLTDNTGKRITSIEVKIKDEIIHFSADTVILSAGAINSAALLLRSANDKHPNGLANSSDVVGRHYMAHNNTAMVALSTRPNPTKFGKTFAVNDFYFGSDSFPYPMGHIQLLGKSDALMFREDAPAFVPIFALKIIANHAVDFWMTSEDLPLKENRVTLDANGQIQLSYTPNNLDGHKQLEKKLRSILQKSNTKNSILPSYVFLSKKIPLAGTAHQCGTIRFGKNPKTSALNINCRAHDVENLYVVDGSFFPSSSAVNPALTIIANALRVGDYLLNKSI
ncbi:MAG: dehydrogenase [Porphyromonadaceae bacterium CG2_30_38_12]|nr:MAG: dehydrogenase [Porphyromonadaceae bacterium CG2_30_38_12]